MIRMIMADKYINMTVTLKISFCETKFRRQFLILAKPIIKDQDGIVASNRKSAVIVMCNKI